MNFQKIIEKVYDQVQALEDKGVLPSYIPELGEVDTTNFAVHLMTLDGMGFGLGPYEHKFSIQSIAKVFSVCLAYKLLGESLWERVGVEPSGNGFNSLLQLENDKGKPRNPFINAGALVISDILISHLDHPKEAFLAFIKQLTPDKDIHYSTTIAASEKSVGYRNVALCNYIKSLGNLNNDPEEVLDFYFDLCSLEISCQQLSNMFLFLTNQGQLIGNGDQVLTKSQSKRINALMQTCGFYDESGEFAFKVGLPGKSGVGGGIIAIHPGQYAIAVWSPMLNPKGNSFKGMCFLESFTTSTEMSIF